MSIVLTVVRERTLGDTEFTDIVFIALDQINVFWAIIDTDIWCILCPIKIRTYTNAFLGCCISVSSLWNCWTKLNAFSRQVISITSIWALRQAFTCIILRIGPFGTKEYTSSKVRIPKVGRTCGTLYITHICKIIWELTLKTLINTNFMTVSVDFSIRLRIIWTLQHAVSTVVISISRNTYLNAFVCSYLRKVTHGANLDTKRSCRIGISLGDDCILALVSTDPWEIVCETVCCMRIAR